MSSLAGKSMEKSLERSMEKPTFSPCRRKTQIRSRSELQPLLHKPSPSHQKTSRHPSQQLGPFFNRSGGCQYRSVKRRWPLSLVMRLLFTIGRRQGRAVKREEGNRNGRGDEKEKEEEEECKQA